jgi:hypothetical protein
MAFPDIFSAEVTRTIINRIEQLRNDTQPQWGTMNAARMLAHCCVTYEMVFESKHRKPGAFARLLLKWFVKESVVGDKPYPRNGRTAPAFLIADERDFNAEKQRLTDYILKVQSLGRAHFELKESNSFGPLTAEQWNTMFYKHLDHHLRQFGV